MPIFTLAFTHPLLTPTISIVMRLHNGAMTTRRLLQLAAFAAANVLVVLALTPVNTAIAVINPLLYAATAALTVIAPFTARVWSGTPGAATMCAVIAGLISAPMSALGFLVIFALALPALTFDLVLWRSRTPRTTRLLIAAAAAGAVIWAISLPVIDPSFLTAAAVVALAVVRVLSYIVAVFIARLIAARLVRIGLRPHIQASA